MPTTRYMVTAEEVRDVLADSAYRDGMNRNEYGPEVFSPLQIAVKILGHNPAAGRQGAAYGGKSAEGWMNEHLSMTHLKKVLAELETAGVIVKFSAPTYHSTPAEIEQARLVRFGYRTKTGYTLATFAEETVAKKEAEARDRRRNGLRRRAQEQILSNHQAEVEEAYLALCKAARLNPALETATPEWGAIR